MKKAVAIFLTLLMTLPFSLALAEGGSAKNSTQLTVRGEAAVTLDADYAVVDLGVTYTDKSITTAQEHNATLMNKLIETLTALGIQKEDMHTSNFSVSPKYNYDYGKLGNNEELEGYTVNNSVSVTIRDLNSLSKILDAAIGAGANQGYGLSFYSLKSEEAYYEALEKAVEKGFKKALTLAEAIDGHLGSIVSINEEGSYFSTGAGKYALMEDSAAGAATPILAENIVVTANVTITYELTK